MNHHQAGCGGEFDGKIAIRHGIERILADLLKAQQLGGGFAADGISGAGQRGGAQRHAVDAAAAIGHALVVAAEHFHISEHVVAEAHRLGHLQVGEAGHHHFGVLLGQIEQGSLKALQQRLNFGDFIAQPQADICGHLIVAAAAGVQAFASIADFIGEAPLDIHVHVFQIQQPRHFADFDFCYNFGHALLDGGQIFCAQHTGLLQHLRMRQRALYVPFGQTFVEINRAGVFFHQLGNRLVEAARPCFIIRHA